MAGFGAAGADAGPTGAVGALSVSDVATLHRLLRRAFQLSRTLPDALLRVFQNETANLPRTTEAERLPVQRVGQNIFRCGLFEYWDGRCAITGLAVPQLLRASHIKPWADCSTDAERLDVFNGLLLAAHLDAAFDAGFITIAKDDTVLLSSLLPVRARSVLGLDELLKVRGLNHAHERYLPSHRANIFRKARRTYASLDSPASFAIAAELPPSSIQKTLSHGLAPEFVRNSDGRSRVPKA